jgi:Zn-finger protein
MSYKFFQNKTCEYFACHKTENIENFNCLFCFCPLYTIKNCGGNFKILKNGIKDCTNCLIPHYNYDYVIDKIKSEK